MTNKFFLENSKNYRVGHLLALLILALGFISSTYELYLAWVVFCLFGIFCYLNKEFLSLLSIEKMAGLIPLIFSIIASFWLFAGANDLHLLGYNREWSYYAALHGNFLGWVLIGSFILISRTFTTPIKQIYYLCAFIFLLFFLLIAFGINGMPYVKRIGAIGIISATPILIGFYSYSLRRNKGASFYFSIVSVISIAFTLCLAASLRYTL